MKILRSDYATFRPDILDYFKKNVLKKPSIILDPMAGTAPLIPFIEMHGHKAYFIDILPVHFYVNRAKTYGIFECYKKYGYDWFFQKLLHCIATLQGKRLRISEKWIDDNTLNGLIQAWHATEEYKNNVASFLKALIILCVRPLSSIINTTNPTWFKFGGWSSKKYIQEIARESLTTFDKYYHYYYESSNINRRGQCILDIDNAAELCLPEKVDFILTSPPYCNRLYPIRQYLPENYFLSILGHSIPEKELIGTTRVEDYDTLEADFEYLTSNSQFANRLLNKIKKSPKADDPIYYLKYYTRYFAEVSRTFFNVLNSLSSEGKMYFVTQDNTHRGELIEIDKVIKELLRENGWKSREIKRWERRHMGLRNISRDHAFVKPKQIEKLVVIWR